MQSTIYLMWICECVLTHKRMHCNQINKVHYLFCWLFGLYCHQTLAAIGVAGLGDKWLYPLSRLRNCYSPIYKEKFHNDMDLALFIIWEGNKWPSWAILHSLLPAWNGNRTKHLSSFSFKDKLDAKMQKHGSLWDRAPLLQYATLFFVTATLTTASCSLLR